MSRPGRERLIHAGALLVVTALMYGAGLAGESNWVTELVAALGFLLLGGMLASEVLEAVGLPHLTGYILVGAAAGPHVLHLVDHGTVEGLGAANGMALCLIALAGGAELQIDRLRSRLRSLAWTSLTQVVIVFLACGGTFLLLAPFLPFARDLSGPALTGAALLWGCLAVSRSPAATLAVLSETRARGPLAEFSLGFVMLSDVVVVVLVALAVAMARPLLVPGMEISLSSLQHVGHELVGSAAVGTTLGLILGGYLRLGGGQVPLVLGALGFVGSDLIHYMRFDPVLCFLVAGFVVTNLTGQGARLLHTVEEVGSLVFVVFFATAGAHLDLPLVAELWPIALALCGVRAVATVVAHFAGTRLADQEPEVRRLGWTSLVSQAGLTLGLGVVIARAFPELGSGFGSLIIATVAINELIGPVLFKLALDRAARSHGTAPSAEVRSSA